MMKGTLQQAVLAARFATLLLFCASCGNDTDTLQYPDSDGIKDGTVNIALTIQTRAAYDETQYQVGSTYENYIDMAHEDYRIYFFTADNKYIATFHPNSFVALEESGYTTYNVLGEVPEGLVANKDDFKVVMLANWGNNYPEDEDFNSGTTIEDICTAEWSKYSFLTNFELSPDNLIPFYGVHEYTDVTFLNNKATTLTDDPITLLRAMAKVEVILLSELGFESVTLQKYNKFGYCAPAGIYSQESYDHNYTWDTDFVSTLHLVDGANDTDQTDHSLNLLKTEDRLEDDQTHEVLQYETWVAYVPEYDNSGSDYAYIEVTFKDQMNYLGTATPYTIYFSDYGDDGKVTNSSNRYNIQRNNLYRFHVTLADWFFQVHVDKWDDIYYNDFTISGLQ